MTGLWMWEAGPQCVFLEVLAMGYRQAVCILLVYHYVCHLIFLFLFFFSFIYGNNTAQRFKSVVTFHHSSPFPPIISCSLFSPSCHRSSVVLFQHPLLLTCFLPYGPIFLPLTRLSTVKSVFGLFAFAYITSAESCSPFLI